VVVGVVALDEAEVVGVVAVDVPDDDGSADEVDDDRPEVAVPPVAVVGVVAFDVDVDAGSVRRVAAAEWAVVSEATRTPNPTAAAVAVTPIVAVTRRTRARALSRACRARWSMWSGCRCWSVMSVAFR
jgi:hypothetical protein